MTPLTMCIDCGELAVYRGRCRLHAQQRNRQTATNRQVYDKRKWHRTRRAYRFEHPLCERCGELAEDVHHKQPIEAGGDRWSPANLEALCHSCHSQATRREQRQGITRGLSAA